MNSVLNNDEICTQQDAQVGENDELCSKNDRICIKNDELCIKNDDLSPSSQARGDSNVTEEHHDEEVRFHKT